MADPPSYDGGAAISGYVMEMENPVTKGQNATFVLYVAVTQRTRKMFFPLLKI